MASGSTDPSLAERLADALPSHAGFTFYHISTPPTRSPAIFSAPPGVKPEKTYTESHFLNVSIRQGDREIFVLAIEVLIYTTRRLTTLFVSKADSTGYLGLLELSKAHASPLRTTATAFLEYLVEKRQRQGRRLVLSLFARASDQYLYPGSVENKSKHVSDDRQLVKWWCRVLDPVLSKYKARDQVEDVKSEQQSVTSQAYLIVPGEDSIVPYLPQHVRLSPDARKRWTHGHPLREIAKHPAAPPRCLVPHFPDDPKARFLDELDDELPDSTPSQTQESPSKRGNGQWRSVRSLEQFWEMMAFRQECSSGRLVGFIWVVFTPPEISASQSTETQDSQTSWSAPASNSETQSTHTSPPAGKVSPRRRRQQPRPVPHRRKKVLKGPIIPRVPKIKSASSAQTAINVPAESKYFIWPASSRGEIVLVERDYKKATERLLALQFKSEEAAVASTKTWVDEVAVLAGKDGGRWGWDVVGRKEAVVVDANGKTGGEGQVNGGGVNTLGVKRKADAITEAPAAPNCVNTLGSGLVKKKKKIQPQQV